MPAPPSSAMGHLSLGDVRDPTRRPLAPSAHLAADRADLVDADAVPRVATAERIHAADLGDARAAVGVERYAGDAGIVRTGIAAFVDRAVAVVVHPVAAQLRAGLGV